VTPKEKILDVIHKEHSVLLDSKDPIFAIMTANDIRLLAKLNERVYYFNSTHQYFKSISSATKN